MTREQFDEAAKIVDEIDSISFIMCDFKYKIRDTFKKVLTEEEINSIFSYVQQITRAHQKKLHDSLEKL